MTKINRETFMFVYSVKSIGIWNDLSHKKKLNINFHSGGNHMLIRVVTKPLRYATQLFFIYSVDQWSLKMLQMIYASKIYFLFM
jgi:hypothetical protein